MKIIFTVICAEVGEHPILAKGIRDTWGNGRRDVHYLWANDHVRIDEYDWVWWRKEGYGAMLWKFLDFLTETSQDSYDYVVKTNTGAYIDVDALHRFLNTVPQTALYAGYIGHYRDEPYDTIDFDYVSGSCTIFSKDVIQMMLGLRADFGPKHIDDVAVGLFMKTRGIIPTRGQRSVDVNDPAYHYYLRSDDGQRHKDVERMHLLHKHLAKHELETRIS